MINRLFRVVATACAAGCVVATTASGQTGAVAVKVIYWKRVCGVPAGGEVPTPVTVGTLVLAQNGQTKGSVTLDTTLTQQALAGGVVQGTLVLETPRVKVVEGAGNSSAQRLKLPDAPVVNGAVTFNVAQGDTTGNGHVNVLMELDRAALLATQATPVILPKVTARVYDGSIGSRPGTKFETPSTIHVGQVDGVDGHWEPDGMTHEYGHFLLETVAPQDPAAAGDHNIGESYPQRRSLAFSEGFPAAFVAVVHPENNGQLFKNCDHYQGLADIPARPGLVSKEAERYSQYNESRVGAATYQLIDYLGKGVTGLKALLAALHKYQREGHAAWTARDLRDLAVQEFEKTPAEHATIDRIFLGQRIWWKQGFALSYDPDGVEGIEEEIALSVTGAGGFDCHVTKDVDKPQLDTLDGGDLSEGVKAASGGLSWSANDDCYMVSGDGIVADGKNPHGMGIDEVDIPFPYLPGLAHWQGWYKVRATYACKPDNRFGPAGKCPATLKMFINVMNPLVVMYDPLTMIRIPITLPLNTPKVIARFKAQGDCEAGDNFVNCSF